ncbi:ABC transporter ATP-binding protein [Ezakiella peruensis]|uniref:ABC transporter ATP-binding protein n=1 Tax=Ezakiella peruensis TaxID=1464038 RepID=UPI001473C397|nr:ABC transporter ATP-binding protein [Ezakiella peruensis]
MKKFKEQSKIYKFIFGFAFKVAKKEMIYIIMGGLLSAAMLFINLFVPKLIIDNIGTSTPSQLLIYGAMLALANLLFAKLPGLIQEAVDNSWDTIYINIRDHMADKTLKLKFEDLENPEIVSIKENADFINRTNAPMISFISSSVNFIISLLKLALITGIALSFSPLMTALMIIIALVQVKMSQNIMVLMNNFMSGIVETNRIFSSFFNILGNDLKQMDVRMFNSEELITHNLNDFSNQINSNFKVMRKKMAKNISLMGVLNVLIIAISYIYTGLRTIGVLGGEKLGLGSFYLYSSALAMFNTNFFDMIKSLSFMNSSAAMIKPLYDYMNLEEEEASDSDKESLKAIDKIEFKNVSFKYPASEANVLNDISFEIHRGEKISIVGLNGAGKTTIIKLLCGFYTANEGQILINDKPIDSYKKKDLQKNISAVFQDYHLFNFTIGENISSDPTYDKAKVEKIISDLNLTERVAKAKDGVDSLVGVGNLEGERFSGGERQKIAIGRALYKDADLVILDEPTSALDPESEAEIYENFAKLVHDKTSIFISHRMSSSVFCDKILLLNNSRVEAFDSHKNLMKNTDSLYYKLFTTQQENYLIEKEKSQVM